MGKKQVYAEFDLGGLKNAIVSKCFLIEKGDMCRLFFKPV